MPAFRLPKLRIDWGNEPEDPTSSETDTSDDQPQKPKKSKASRTPGFVGRLLGLKIGEVVSLVMWCVVCGVIMRFTNWSPYVKTEKTDSEKVADASQQVLEAAGWAFQNGWKPALTGATVIIPLWFAWRVLTFPFRR